MRYLMIGSVFVVCLAVGTPFLIDAMSNDSEQVAANGGGYSAMSDDQLGEIEPAAGPGYENGMAPLGLGAAEDNRPALVKRLMRMHDNMYGRNN